MTMTKDNSYLSADESVELKAGAINVSKVERIAMTIGGAALIGYASMSRSKTGILLGIFGGAMVYRAASGYYPLYGRLGINTAEPEESDEIANEIHIEKSITINRTPEELYSFWRNFENLPRLMPNIKAVTNLGGDRSHWVADGPGGKTVEWDAEIYNDIPNTLIAWRSLPGSDVTNAGSVNFKPAPSGRGTYVKVTFNYNPPAGKAGFLLAKLFGREPGQLVEHDLRRLKQLFETGVIPTIEGQTSGRLEATESLGGRKEDQIISQPSQEDSLAREARGGLK